MIGARPSTSSSAPLSPDKEGSPQKEKPKNKPKKPSPSTAKPEKKPQKVESSSSSESESDSTSDSDDSDSSSGDSSDSDNASNAKKVRKGKPKGKSTAPKHKSKEASNTLKDSFPLGKDQPKSAPTCLGPVEALEKFPKVGFYLKYHLRSAENQTLVGKRLPTHVC